MGRQSSDSIVVHSSIVLLQERFRQLQRAKEMREERELLRLLSESERVVNPTARYEPSRLFFHSELINPPRPSLQHSPYLQTNPQGKNTDLHVIETPLLANLWSTDAVMHRRNVFDDVSDVDTSLHL